MNPVAVFLLCAASLSAQTSYGPNGPIPQQSQPVVSIQFDINAAEQLAGVIRQHMTQQFQAIPGVQVVEENPQWTIKVVTQALLDGEGNTMAIGLSVVTLEHGPQMNMLSTLAQAWHYILNAGLLQRDQPLEVGMRKLVAAIDRLPKTESLTVLSQHVMCVIPTQKLGDACRDIAADFNKRVLQPKAMTQGESAERAAAAPAHAAQG